MQVNTSESIVAIDSIAEPGHGGPLHHAASARKAMIGGGWITTPAVAAHVRKTMADAGATPPQGQPVQRKALVGGGWITTPAVAAHLRKNRTRAELRSTETD